MNWLDVSGAATGALAVLLLVCKSLWNWPAAILNAAIYVVAFASVGLFADAGLQFVFIAISVYGWMYWVHGGTAHREAPIAHLTLRGHALTIVLIAISTAIFASVLQRWFHSTVPVWDGLTTALSLAAIALQSRKYIENWYYWIVADIIYVPLYLYKGLPWTAALFLVYIGMCVAGVIVWNRALTARPTTV